MEKQKEILIIDDSPTQVNTLKIVFSRSNFKVQTASSAQEGYCKIFESVPDLVLSDIIMPDLNGYQLCRLIKNNELTKNIPVVLLTVLEQKIDKFWGTKSGANMFISKIAPVEELLLSCQNLIEKYPVLPEIKEKIKDIHVAQESVQTKIKDVLDDSLVYSTIVNEFRSLSENLGNETELAQNIFKLSSSILDYDIFALWFADYNANLNKLYIDSSCEIDSDLTFDIADYIVLQIDKISKEKDIEYECSFKAQNLERLNEKQSLSFTKEKIINFVSNNQDSKIQIDSIEDFETKIFVPIVFDKKFLGCIFILKKNKPDYKMQKLFKIVKEELKLIFRIKKLYSQTNYLSMTDGLTNLYNRRQFDETLINEFERSKRYGSNLTLCLIDVDHFKSINDTYGHKTGDYVLSALAKKIMASFRKSDFVFRYGGEEIMVILPETTSKQALFPANRLKNMVEQMLFEYDGNKLNITISIGIAQVEKYITMPDDFIKNADNALYQAKNEGRNRVIVYEPK